MKNKYKSLQYWLYIIIGFELIFIVVYMGNFLKLYERIEQLILHPLIVTTIGNWVSVSLLKVFIVIFLIAIPIAIDVSIDKQLKKYGLLTKRRFVKAIDEWMNSDVINKLREKGREITVTTTNIHETRGYIAKTIAYTIEGTELFQKINSEEWVKIDSNTCREQIRNEYEIPKYVSREVLHVLYLEVQECFLKIERNNRDMDKKKKIAIDSEMRKKRNKVEAVMFRNKDD